MNMRVVHVLLTASFFVRGSHPTERIIGTFNKGDIVDVQVLPFRSCLLLATSKPTEFGIRGCDYEVIRDIPGKPVLVKLLAMPGEKKTIKLVAGDRIFKSGHIAGRRSSGLVKGKSTVVSFPGRPLQEMPHRKLGDLTPCEVPAYVPLTEDMVGAKIDAVVLGMRGGVDTFKPEVWITAYPAPFSERLLTLIEK
jgi:hypothetical protein